MDNKNNIASLDGRFQRLEEIVEKILLKIQTRNDATSSSAELLHEKLTSMSALHEKDFDIIKKQIETINVDFSDLYEKCQEIQGEINQIKLSFEKMKARIDDNNKKASNFMNNCIYPSIGVLFGAILYLLVDFIKSFFK